MAAVACGLTVVGSGPEDAGPDTTLPSVEPPEAAAADDAGVDGEDPKPSEDAGCVPIVIDDPLTAIDELRWLKSSTQADYPMAKDAGTGTTMAAVNASMQPSQRAGLWLRERVPTTAFDVTFDYLVACNDGAYCADGVAVAWVDTTNTSDLSNGNAGRALGIPKLGGGAAAIKLDVKLADPDDEEDTFPTLMIHAMDAGPSDETPTGTTVMNSLVGELRKATLRLRDGKLTVTSSNAAGEVVTVSGPTRSGFLAYFGFSASTGLHFDAAFVGSFHGEFYACQPPT